MTAALERLRIRIRPPSWRRLLLWLWYVLLFRDCLRFLLALNSKLYVAGDWRPWTHTWVGFWPSDYYASDALGIVIAAFYVWMLRRSIEREEDR